MFNKFHFYFILILFLGGCKTFFLSKKKPIKVKIIALNDFHGNLRAHKFDLIDGKLFSSFLKVNSPATIGGVEFLASWVKKLKKENPLNVFVSAGDLIGASPLISNFFHDEPTIEAMNLIGLDLNGVGNHEFDKGIEELFRMQNGGCHLKRGCRYGSKFKGAKFKFLAANVKDLKTKKTIFPAYEIKYFKGVPIAFIAVAPKDTLSFLPPNTLKDIIFQDEVEAINNQVRILRKKGVKAFVALIHEGGEQKGGYNNCTELQGPIVEIVNKLDPDVEVVISGHTHNAYNCNIGGKLLTSALSYGKLLSEIDIQLDPKTKKISSKKATNLAVINSNEIDKDLAQSKLLKNLDLLTSKEENEVVGSTFSLKLSHEANQAGQSPLGSLIADAQLEATKKYGSQIAFINKGGIRNSIIPNERGEITYGNLFSIQPYSNYLFIIEIKGSQIKEILEQQFINYKGGKSLILQISKGFSYQWDNSKSLGSKVDIKDIKLNNQPIKSEGIYKITINDFLYQGGDGFDFPQNTPLQQGPIDIEATKEYFKKNSPLENKEQNRIKRIN
jgi:5'-nucleotidase